MENEWFKHPYNSRNDSRMLDLFAAFGHEGISVYWGLIELLYEGGGYLSLAKIDTYAFALRTHSERLARIVQGQCDGESEFKLFCSDEKKFWSPEHLEKIKERQKKSRSASNSAKNKWVKYYANAERTQMPSQSERIPNASAVAEQTQSERSANKNKSLKENKQKKKFIPPTVEEILAFLPGALAKKNKECKKPLRELAEQIFDHYHPNWKAGSKDMSDWHKAIYGWIDRDFDRIFFTKQAQDVRSRIAM